MSTKIRVLVVDDNALLRTGLSDVISDESDMVVVGEASNGVEALEQYAALDPDVVTMDYRMPAVDGVDATHNIMNDFPDAKIIFLSMYEGEEDVWKAWQAGIRGYLGKMNASDEVVDAIREVGDGSSYFPASIVRKLERRKEQDSLTARELEVLALIVDGFSNKGIMAELNLSASTVRVHVSRILEKMGVVDRTQAAVAAIKRGVVHLD